MSKAAHACPVQEKSLHRTVDGFAPPSIPTTLLPPFPSFPKAYTLHLNKTKTLNERAITTCLSNFYVVIQLQTTTGPPIVRDSPSCCCYPSVRKDFGKCPIYTLLSTMAKPWVKLVIARIATRTSIWVRKNGLPRSPPFLIKSWQESNHGFQQ